MPGRFIIRTPLSSAEWDEVKQLLIAYESEFEDKTCFTSFEAEMKDIQQLYKQQDKVKLIAFDEESKKVAGCVALREFAPGVTEMKRLYVRPEYRGHHLGRLLAEAILQKGKEKKYNSMILDTMMEMKSAQKLYEELGFTIIPPYNQQDSNKIICFEKKLQE